MEGKTAWIFFTTVVGSFLLVEAVLHFKKQKLNFLDTKLQELSRNNKLQKTLGTLGHRQIDLIRYKSPFNWDAEKKILSSLAASCGLTSLSIRQHLESETLHNNVLKSIINLEISATHDKSIYFFLHEMMGKYPAYIHFLSLKLSKDQNGGDKQIKAQVSIMKFYDQGEAQ